MMTSLVLAAVLLDSSGPIVIAHRGASGHRPEHTLAAYELAMEMGADYVEPDLVATKDGVLVCRHENEISGTTDVATRQEFASRKTTKTIDGDRLTGWFTEDFTLAELKTLKAKERLPQLRKANVAFDGQFEVPTLQELLQLIVRKQKQIGKRVGVYPETKHPSYFRSINLPLEPALLKTLRSVPEFSDQRTPEPLVFIQSFEVNNLKDLNRESKYKLIQLLNTSGKTIDTQQPTEELISPEGLKEIASYAYGIGPSKELVIRPDKDGKLIPESALVNNAHAVGLKVHPYTFRKEPVFVPKAYRQNPDQELRMYLRAGIDGFFTDFPDMGREVVDSEAKKFPKVR